MHCYTAKIFFSMKYCYRFFTATSTTTTSINQPFEKKGKSFFPFRSGNLKKALRKDVLWLSKPGVKFEITLNVITC